MAKENKTNLINNNNEENIYNMKIHDSLRISKGLDVLRVPGGWIYTIYDENGTGWYSTSSCFVRFDNEFMWDK